MTYEIIELEELSGNLATIYSVIIEDEEYTLFDSFVEENSADYPDEVKFIVNRLYSIGHSTGAREQFFKLNEGKPGDGVCALYDEEDSNLRQYGTQLLGNLKISDNEE